MKIISPQILLSEGGSGWLRVRQRCGTLECCCLLRRVTYRYDSFSCRFLSPPFCATSVNLLGMYFEYCTVHYFRTVFSGRNIKKVYKCLTSCFNCFVEAVRFELTSS